MINFIVLSLFNEAFTSFLNTSIIKRSIESKKLNIKLVDIRDFSEYKNKKVDDTPYGGGSGMVISPVPISKALDYAISCVNNDYEIIYMSPRGRLLNYNVCNEYANMDKTYILICGHYEGIDERVLQLYNITEISVGDYVLTGGELPAMIFIDSVTRLFDGVITKESLLDESHTNGLLEYPQYTKPSVFRGVQVPEVLLNGNHKKINEFRQQESIKITIKNRPDLFENYNKGGEN
jgi:tRNA (guanine37-N1)-methyltransferase